MPKYFIAIFLFSINIRGSFSQVKLTYINANIKLVNGESLTGFIKENDEIRMSKGILFKKSPDDLEEKLLISSEISRITLDSNIIYDQLHFQESKVSERVLARKIVSGTASLYKFIFNDILYFSIVKSDSTYFLKDDNIVNGRTFKRSFFQNYLNQALKVNDHSENKYLKIRFSEKDFIKAVTEYNESVGSKNTIYKFQNKRESYLYGFLGGGIIGLQNEVYGQLLYRSFFPRSDKNIFYNIGLNYYNTNLFRGDGYLLDFPTNFKYISIPISVQQNFSSKRVKLYFQAGINVTNRILVPFYVRNKIGLNIHYGGGIEANVEKTGKILAKLEVKNEVFFHIVTLGLGYNFLKF